MSNALILTAKSSEEKETGGISNLSSSIAKGRDQGKPLENVSSKFFVGTEVSLGYILYRLEKLTLEKKSRYSFAQWFVGPKYFHPARKFYLIQLTLLSNFLVFEIFIRHIPGQNQTDPFHHCTIRAPQENVDET